MTYSDEKKRRGPEITEGFVNKISRYHNKQACVPQACLHLTGR